MSNGFRSAEKETSWRVHVGWQASSGVSVRAYCREHELSEPSFHWWRREIRRRDAEQECRQRMSLAVADKCKRSTETDGDGGLTQKRSVNHDPASSRHSNGAGLVALDIVCDARPTIVSPIIEIGDPAGIVVRLREEVSAEVLQRVIVAFRRSHTFATSDATNAASANREVRSC